MPSIHITGAAGAGTTTLGAALAERLGVAHLDTDDFYWAKTDPPFTAKRPIPERLAQMRSAMAARPEGWVLSGSILDWGNPLIAAFDLVIFMITPTPLRLARLNAREARRYGKEIEPGGKMHDNTKAFLDWASHYDEPDFDGRSRARHEAWLAALPCPVLRLEGTRALADLLSEAYPAAVRHQGFLRPPS